MYSTNNASVGGILSLARDSSIEDFDHFTQSNILELEMKMYDMFGNSESYEYIAAENNDIDINRLREINNLLFNTILQRRGAEDWREYLKYFKSVLAVTSFYTAIELESPLYSKILLFFTALGYKLLNMYIESAMLNRDRYRRKYDVYLSAISEAYKKSYISLEPIDKSKEPPSPRAKTIASTKTELISIFKAFVIALYRVERSSGVKIEDLKKTCLITCYINLFSAAIYHISENGEFPKLTAQELNAKSSKLTLEIEALLIENIEYMKNKYFCTTYNQDHEFNEKVSHFHFMKILSEVYRDGKGNSNKYTDQEIINRAFPDVVDSMEKSIQMWVEKSLSNACPTPASAVSPVEICSPNLLSSRSIDSLPSLEYLSFSGQAVERDGFFRVSKSVDEQKSDRSSVTLSILSSIGFRSPNISRSSSIDSFCNSGQINGLEEIEKAMPSEQKESIEHFVKAATIVRNPSTGKYLFMFTCIGLIVSSCFYSISFNVRFDINHFKKYVSIFSGIIAFMLGQKSDDILESAQKRYYTLQESKKDLVTCVKNGFNCSSRIESYDLDRKDNKEKRKQIYYVIGATWSMLKYHYNMNLDSFHETDISFMTMRMYMSMIRAFEEANSISFLANIEQLNSIAKNWSDLIYKNSFKSLDVFHPFNKYSVSLTSVLSVDSLYKMIAEEIDISEIRSKSDSIQKKWSDVLGRKNKLVNVNNKNVFFPDNGENISIINTLERTSKDDLLNNNYNMSYGKIPMETPDTTRISSELSYAEEGRATEFSPNPIGQYTSILQEERSVDSYNSAFYANRCIVM